MRHLFLILTLCLAACYATADAPDGLPAAGSGAPAAAPLDVGVSAQAVCTPPSVFTRINSNNGHYIDDGSCKLRALRAWVMQLTPCGTNVQNFCQCSGDTCTCCPDPNGFCHTYALKECFDYAGSQVRECVLYDNGSRSTGTGGWCQALNYIQTSGCTNRGQYFFQHATQPRGNTNWTVDMDNSLPTRLCQGASCP